MKHRESEEKRYFFTKNKETGRFFRLTWFLAGKKTQSRVIFSRKITTTGSFRAENAFYTVFIQKKRVFDARRAHFKKLRIFQQKTRTKGRGFSGIRRE
jgi:hypothetical protein